MIIEVGNYYQVARLGYGEEYIVRVIKEFKTRYDLKIVSYCQMKRTNKHSIGKIFSLRKNNVPLFVIKQVENPLEVMTMWHKLDHMLKGIK